MIAGHGSLLAAQKLGFTEAPCMVAEGWIEAQKRAYVIADNKLALNAGSDEEMLAGAAGGGRCRTSGACSPDSRIRPDRQP